MQSFETLRGSLIEAFQSRTKEVCHPPEDDDETDGVTHAEFVAAQKSISRQIPINDWMGCLTLAATSFVHTHYTSDPSSVYVATTDARAAS